MRRAGRRRTRGTSAATRSAHGAAFAAALASVLDEQIVSGGTVARHWRISGTHTGADLAGIPARGHRFEVTGATFIAIHGGRCRRLWILVDRLSLRAQLG